jgi:peptide/nickel transport system permease protein
VNGRLGAGLAITAAIVALALVSLVWTPEPPTRMHIALKLRPPLAAGPVPGSGLLGTDNFGRDVLSMLMAGAWNSLAVAVPSVALGGVLGTLLGVTAAGRRGVFDAIAMRALDVVFAFPPILSAMMLGSLLGPGRLTAVAAIAIFIVPVFARVTRGAALRIWGRDYILAARGAGKGGLRIASEHVLPNIVGQIAVQVTVQLGLAILTEAGLSYVGLGAPPPTPSWGRMLADAQTYLAQAPWLVLAPGVAVAVTVLGFNLLGDGLRDRWDRRGTVAP